jgi:hypothetical protein
MLPDRSEFCQVSRGCEEYVCLPGPAQPASVGATSGSVRRTRQAANVVVFARVPASFFTMMRSISTMKAEDVMVREVHQSLCLVKDIWLPRLITLKSDGIYQNPQDGSKPTIALANITRIRLGVWTITILGVSEDGSSISFSFSPFLGVGWWGYAFRSCGITCENEKVFSRDSFWGFLYAYPALFAIAPSIICSALGWIAIVVEQEVPRCKPWPGRIVAALSACFGSEQSKGHWIDQVMSP